jgi:hypothetical protein
MVVRVAQCIWVLLVLAGSAAAQVPAGPPLVIQYVPKDVEGAVAGIRQGFIAVSIAENDAWTFQLPNDVTVRIVGKAEPDVLRVGQYIRFQGAVDKQQSKVVDKVSQLTVFSPEKDDLRTPGVFLPGQCVDLVKLKFKEDRPPSDLPAELAKDSAASKSAEGKPTVAETKTAATAADQQIYDIHAQITAVKGNMLTLNVPNSRFKPTLRIELAENPAIDLDLTEFSLVRPGDKIVGRGLQLGPRLLQVTDMTIRLSEPLSTAKKKPAKPASKPAATKPKSESS